MSNSTFGQRVTEFNINLDYPGPMPPGYDFINPFRDSPMATRAMGVFYQKFYSDNIPRTMLIGINPSRHGAGVTGVPFTDTKRLLSHCGIELEGQRTHEVSSVFIYDLIDSYGGVSSFYRDFYINSPFPLAIVRRTKSGGEVNANYYDDHQLYQTVEPFMIEMMKAHLAMGVRSDKAFVLGKKNGDFIKRLNTKARFFDELVVLEHPRFIQQYKYKERSLYIDKYLLSLHNRIEYS